MLTFSELNLQPELDLEKTNTQFASSELESLGIFNAKNSEEEEIDKNNELESLGIFNSQQNSISTPEIITPPKEVIDNNVLENNEVTELPVRPQKLIDLNFEPFVPFEIGRIVVLLEVIKELLS